MRIALIAHDDEKPEMIAWAKEHEAILAANDLIGTGTTGGRLTDETGLSVTRMASGPLGGDLMIGSAIVTGDCDAVVFFRDPMTAQPHEPDISALLRICDVHGIPLATNRASATALLTGLVDSGTAEE
ncbi:methylglyoxal synthase [Natronomonas sp. LN261]|jgi:methylglyoxal synthase|uniref:methylglyoxal synthase n=1 Tax=Natronomonas sp. LN261 TaxID=2750669 RepID=UPI0015EF9414|nr:methylglyoxal synthase [Natronomonas sp. LN261]